MTRRFVWLLAPMLFLAACSSSKSPDSDSLQPNPNANASLNKADYPVFPDADAGADPAVSAEQGGKGFKGEGWETNTDFDLVGDPRANRGGVLREFAAVVPGTFRIAGPEWNTSTNFAIANMVYENLLTLDPATLKFAPVLATHWQVSPDKMTYRFRINPTARWSDGQPVTADDVVASWTFYTDKTLQDPTKSVHLLRLEKPVAESKYIVQVKAKTLHWQNFQYVSTGMMILPAHVLKNMDGAAYLRDYNFKLLPNTGPYSLAESDIEKGKSVTVRRRKDYWAEKARLNAGMNNFDSVRWTIVRDQNLAFEMFKKGDFDVFQVSRSRQWVEDLKFDKVQNGLILKRKVFHEKPEGLQGFPMNTRRPPFDDIRVRKALALLLNRELLLEKLFFNEYLPDNSFYPGSVYENPNNPKNTYNPQEALKLLAEAGWKDHDAQGRLTKNGKPLGLEMLYDDKQQEAYLTVYQEDLRKLGITMNLRLVTNETRWKLINKHEYEMSMMKWGIDVFPSPESEYHSALADRLDSDNLTGFKDPRIDQICEKYAKAFDVKERVALMRELDGILTSQYHYVLHWYPPADRVAYWNKFSQPRGTLTRIGSVWSNANLGPGVEQMWWIDPAKAQKLEKAMRDPSIKLNIEPVEDRYWQDYAKTEQTKEASK
jgi:microcin C transport system substrate-binding protein